MIAIYLIVVYFAVASLAAIFIYIPYLIAGRVVKSLHIGDFIMSCIVWSVCGALCIVLVAAALLCTTIDACISLFKPQPLETRFK
jgi:hypothetical protein